LVDLLELNERNIEKMKGNNFKEIKIPTKYFSVLELDDGPIILRYIS
jgi:hypothetical protein